MPRLAKPYRNEIEYAHACRQLGVMVPQLHADPAGAMEAVQELHAKSRATLARRAAPANAVANKLSALLATLPEADAWTLVRQLEQFSASPLPKRRALADAILAATSLEELDAALAARSAKRRKRL